MVRRAFRAVAVAVTLHAAGAHATVGGPALVEPMGWDAEAQRVYFRTVHVDDFGHGCAVIYFDLGSEEPRRLRHMTWKGLEVYDKECEVRLQLFRSRLQPLAEFLRPTLPRRLQVVAVDTLREYGSRIPRYRLRVEGAPGIFFGSLEVTTLQAPDVRLVRCYRVAGRDEVFGVAAFPGVFVGTEGVYEAQVPVVLPQNGDSLSVEYRDDW